VKFDWTAISAAVGDSATFTLLNMFGERHAARATTREVLAEYLAAHHGWDRERFFTGTGPMNPDTFDERRAIWRSRSPSGYGRNDTVRADIYLCKQGWKAPTVLMLHAFMSASDVGYRIWAAKFNAAGWNACFVHLPYHYSRRPPGFWNGELAITCDVIRTGEGLRQAVVDLRDLMAMLRERGTTNFGLWGSSYGGWIGGLLLSVEKDFRFAMLMEPIVDVDHAIWESIAGWTLRRHLKRRGLTREHYAACLEWLSPQHGRPLCEKSPIYVLAGTHDRIARPQELRKFADAWGAKYAEHPQGHIGYSLMPASFAMLEKDGLLDRSECGASLLISTQPEESF